MINAWSLAYDVLNGTLDENFPIKKKTMSKDEIKLTGADEGVVNVPTDITLDQDSGDINITTDIEHSDAWYDYTRNDPDRENPFTDPKDRARADRVVGKSNDDTITITGGDDYAAAVDSLVNDMPLSFNTFADNDDSIAHHIELNTADEFVNFDLGVGNTAYSDTLNLNIQTPGIESNNPRKYKEDESIKALQDYISTTYCGHYTSDNNKVQTLDLIESVGDAEAFCRSNAIKYLSRYDKKGQAKRDILKALHYSLLLYHFSGQLNETPTRGYETF